MSSIFYMMAVSGISYVIMFGRFFVFSPALAVIVLLPFLISCRPMNDIMIHDHLHHLATDRHP
jgi:hypothetical protein